MIILGIETSCDETAAAIIERRPDGGGKILANIIRSQIAEHAAYGGVVPEIAARAHVEILDNLVKQALAAAGLRLADMDAFAAAGGPGLIGGLLVGLTTAKMLALAAGKPFLPINHLEGHALTARLTDNVAFPYLLLLVSGGHTQIVLAEGVGQYKRLGTTLDDALGESFDKTAKLLGLPYPGGPMVEQAAKSGKAENFALPRPLKGEKGCDFSFSGLKTAVRSAALQQIEANAAQGRQGLTEQNIADICAAFEAAIADCVADRLTHAFAAYRRAAAGAAGGKPVLVAAGGVAANGALRRVLQALCAEHGFALVLPPPALCGDNAAMIAFAAAERLAADNAPEPAQSGLAGGALQKKAGIGRNNNMDFAARARWPLDESAAAKLGSGRKGAKA